MPSPQAPHKEQDGWAYIRVRKCGKEAGFQGYMAPTYGAIDTGDWCMYRFFTYDDTFPDSRVISSRRVERAVETDDFMRLCQQEGLTVQRGGWSGSWTVFDPRVSRPTAGIGDTLREAYYRFRALRGDAND